MPANEERLASLLVAWEEARAGSVAMPSLEEFCASHESSDLIHDFREMVACFDSLHIVEETEKNLPSGADADDAPPSDERFRVKSVLGRGGLGVVYLAEDLELKRDVALKSMQRQARLDEMARARFLREAELTGRLDHPGVVPVHTLAHGEANAYYTMRVIAGGSMQDAIDQYHARSPDPLEQRRLLRGFVAACETVAFAHSRGVIHRDLKPQNIMLGAYGETLVIDWGLATDRPAAGPEPSEDSPARPGDSPVASELTLAGRAMGTWGYMSPEQARGDWNQVGPASDIFSLGATLYRLLTGRPPYHGPDAKSDALACRFDRPSRVVPGVSRPLEAICLRAMAADPRDRYVDARALAADVERWLADEPVTAYRDPLSVRLRRWARRHRTIVTSAAALLITAVIGLAAGLYFVNREKQQTENARRKTSEALDRMSLAQHRTRQALDDTTDMAAERLFARQPRLTAADRAFLQRILDHYTEFAQESGDSPELRESAANSHLRAGYILNRLGKLPDAEAAFRASADQYQQVADSVAGSENSILRYARTRALNNLAVLLVNSSRLEEATSIYDQLERELTALIPELDSSLSIGARQVLAYVHNGQGKIHRTAGRQPDALTRFEQAAVIHRELKAEQPTNPIHAHELARVLFNIGPQLFLLKRPKEAEAALLESVRLCEELVRDHPGEPDYVADQAKTMSLLALEVMSRLQIPRGLELLRGAVRLLRPLVLEYPSDVEFRAALAAALRNLGFAQRRFPTARVESETSLREAVQLLDRLVEESPESVEHRVSRTIALHGLGELVVRDTPGDAARFLDQAMDDSAAVFDGGNGARLHPFMLVSMGISRAELATKSADRSALARAAAHLHRFAVGQANNQVASARYFARAARLSARDSSESWWYRPLLADRHARDAVESLKAALEAGFKDAAALQGEDFVPLRGREDFQKLLERLRPTSR